MPKAIKNEQTKERKKVLKILCIGSLVNANDCQPSTEDIQISSRLQKDNDHAGKQHMPRKQKCVLLGLRNGLKSLVGFKLKVRNMFVPGNDRRLQLPTGI